ncbi:CG3679 [Drosophila busckii]|uniref:CG3679 n=1 Tax=Drosophila busckii TaxID=30019 RepID=A0A0M3QYT8_DROBS|nr:uncharacterized protein LOC108607148 [Drosophila busckii]ALC48189.1 CG3679 [Drosophila busckii]
MCDTGNLIDLGSWDEPAKEDTVLEENESMIVESTCFKGPYDPFDSVAKEACIKGQHYNDNMLKYADQQLMNETPPEDINGLSPSPVVSIGREPFRQQSLQKQMFKLSASRSTSLDTPPHHSSKIFKMCENLQMLAAESPVKFQEDEASPITPNSAPNVSPLSDDTCSNKEFEERLKQLRIAMLDTPTTSSPTELHNTPEEKEVLKPLANDIPGLLEQLRELVNEHVDHRKRQLFERIIVAVATAIDEQPQQQQHQQSLTKDLPHIYTRQATFDLELEQKSKTADVDSQLLLPPPHSKVDKQPDLMTCSSATYDTEPVVQDKPISPIKPSKSDAFVTELANDNLALQINELIERHNLARLTGGHEHATENNENKPTVILVVNSTGANALPSCMVHPSKAKELSESASSMRRRSSSLSIHDKAKAKAKDAKQAANEAHARESAALRELSIVHDKSNTMAAFRQRRNSFSIGSSATQQPSAKRFEQSRLRSRASIITEAIPVKRVVPIVKSSLASPTETAAARCNIPDTPMPSRSKITGKLFATSTPMPQMRAQQRRSLKPVNSYANNSCVATPTVRAGNYLKKSSS